MPEASGAAQVDIRDHEANERTYLAWARTGVTLILLGLATSELLVERGQPQRFVGLVTALGGLFAIVYAFVQFMLVEKRLERARYAPHRVGPAVLSTLLVIGGVVAILGVSGR